MDYRTIMDFKHIFNFHNENDAVIMPFIDKEIMVSVVNNENEYELKASYQICQQLLSYKIQN